jgi:hypothetical protein
MQEIRAPLLVLTLQVVLYHGALLSKPRLEAFIFIDERHSPPGSAAWGRPLFRKTAGATIKNYFAWVFHDIRSAVGIREAAAHPLDSCLWAVIDVHRIPFSVRTGEDMTDLMIHAHILAGMLDRRAAISELTPEAARLLLIAVSGMGFYERPRRRVLDATRCRDQEPPTLTRVSIRCEKGRLPSWPAHLIPAINIAGASESFGRRMSP